MNEQIEFNSLLVPVDFSPASEAAFRHALHLASGEKPAVILLHVIDPSLVDFATEHGWGSESEVTSQMRTRAEQSLEEYRSRGKVGVEIDTIVSEGVPFLEILRKSVDFAVDAVVIGKVSSRNAIEKMLFGSTAEKVIRASLRPVVVVPVDE